jgi:hypothetical protein
MGFINDLIGATNDFRATEAKLPQQDFGADLSRARGNIQTNYGAQGDFINALKAQAAGQGPSLAQALLQRQTDANNSNAASSIASNRSLNPALASRLILQTQAGQQQQAAGQGALLRSKEQLDTQALLAHALQAQGAQAGGMYGAAAGANQGQNALALQNHQGTDQINAGITSGNAAQNASTAGGILGGAAKIATLGLSSGGPSMAAQTFSQGPESGAGSYSAYGNIGVPMPFREGGPVPGAAPVAGDSPKNDIVPAELSPGEIVIPRSVAQAEDAPERAAAFVRAIRRSDSSKSDEAPDFGKVLTKLRQAKAHLADLEKMCRGGMAA